MWVPSLTFEATRRFLSVKIQSRVGFIGEKLFGWTVQCTLNVKRARQT